MLVQDADVVVEHTIGAKQEKMLLGNICPLELNMTVNSCVGDFRVELGNILISS